MWIKRGSEGFNRTPTTLKQTFSLGALFTLDYSHALRFTLYISDRQRLKDDSDNSPIVSSKVGADGKN